MSSVEIQTNAALAVYLAGLGVATPNPIALATQALTKDAKEQAEREAEVIAGLLGGAQASIKSAAIAKFDLEKQAAKKDEEAKKTARAMAYLLETGNKLPLQKLMGIPVPKHLEEAAKIADDWQPRAVGTAAAAATST